jgi:hypothetical protein
MGKQEKESRNAAPLRGLIETAIYAYLNWYLLRRSAIPFAGLIMQPYPLPADVDSGLATVQFRLPL